MNLLITGASGFVGQHLLKELTVRQIPFDVLKRGFALGDLAGGPYDAVIHLAARAHIMQDTAADPLAEFRKVNVDFTLNMARQAAAMGVRRFVYVSSVKVNGEETTDAPFSTFDTPHPIDVYGISKLEAEQALTALALQTGMEVVIVRPPLIYGAGVKANFARLVRLAAKGIPLPFGSIHNRRSLLYIENLVDFLILCTHHPKAANETFLLSDGEDVSTTHLLKTLAHAQGVSSCLLPIPAAWLRCAMKAIGKNDMAQRLLGNLQVDSSKARTLLEWTPPFTFEQGIKRSVF